MASTMCESTQNILQQLEQTKQTFWSNNAHLTEEQRQDLWNQAASFPPSTAYTTSHASMAYQTPRSLPTMSNMAHFPTIDYETMDRRLSAPTITPSTSTTATDAHELPRSTSTWPSMSQEAAGDYTFYSDASMRQQQALQSIPEMSTFSNEGMTEYSPQEYITNYIEPSSSSSLPSSIHAQQIHVPLTPSFQWASSSDGSTAPSTPSTALTTPVTQSSNAMSRQSSCASHFLADDSSMLRTQSNSSCILPILPEDGVSFFPFDVESKTVSPCVDPSLVSHNFVGSSNEDFLSSLQSSVSVSAHALASSENMPYLAEHMRRSASQSSGEGNASDTSAAASNYSRQSRRDHEIALATARKIAPKVSGCDDETESKPSYASMASIQSEDGSSKTVGVISKTPYVRPQHPKIMCQFCHERPEGFRGTHELDRHIARAHTSRRKAYICVDYSQDKKFLANCKHCRNKKAYGAYYNAAAHLRRAHFHPRKRGRKGKNDEKRGGIGGGDHPPMDYLKQNWIKEVEVDRNNVIASPISAASDDANDATDNACESTFDMDASYTAQQPTSTLQVQLDPTPYMDGFDLSLNPGETVMYDANTFGVAAYDVNNVAAITDASSFQFDAYM
ncbi:hypothetical protein BDU57DRAFT_542149 [Ampelomyces quisqualis]|uniref:DUF7896 domain-containing protein n=1 Tax=Ampelomyces quisqualis TaxID=50730 RepID=A0A6A5QAB8_AMPQU|nr:hypothetical protein BDU57DRAFT_542149 [Ampelomyces quisqualis]